MTAAAAFLAAAFPIDGTIGTVGVILAVLSGIAVALAYTKSQVAQNTIDLLQQNVEALEGQNKIQARDIDGLKKQNTEQGIEMRMLKDMVTGTKQIDGLAKKLAAQHAEVLTSIRDLADAIRTQIHA